MYSDRNLINSRNVTQDPHSNYRANRDFFFLILKSRVITAAMEILGIKDKTGQPSKFTIPDNICNLQKLQKLEVLQKAAGLIVDKFLITDELTKVTESVMTVHEREQVLNQQVLTPDGRFPCRFIGCTASFRYDGKSRRKHELSHTPPPVVDSPSTRHQAPSKKSDYDTSEKKNTG